MMRSERPTLCLSLVVLLTSILAAVGQNCAGQPTCKRCISQPGCAWCFQETYSGMRCLPIGNLTTCNPAEIANPSSSFLEDTTIDGPVSLSDVTLELRVGDPQSFTVRVTPKRNLPLDLYILIDLSASMSQELATIQSIASQIGSRVSEVTSNVRLGLGSFNEKVVQPFSSETLDIDAPSPRPDRYAFRHSVNLTSNDTAFAAEVQDASTTANADHPENGLEGLAQVITCEEIIGWRERQNGIGTRVVLFMTDQEFHFAGEGRFAGILTPYNGECLLEPNPSGGPVEFTRFTEFDYPSVGQILDLLREYDVTTIFAIQEDHLDSYQLLASSILNINSLRAVVAGFRVDEADSGTEEEILNLIEQEYRRILQGVSLDISNVTSEVTIQIVPTCPPMSNRVEDTCESVPLDSSVNFTVSITLNSCDGLTNGQMIRHTITSPSFGSFDLMFRVICECDCAEAAVMGEDICTEAGARTCGVCICESGRCGSNCNQVIGNRTSLDCPRGGVNNERCSGRGTCDCTCMCNQPEDSNLMISGEACECDNFRCDTDDQGRVCSGRGMCCEGSCRCGRSPDGNLYRGEPDGLEQCQCEPLEEACMDPETNILCNNLGTCGCEFCSCESGFIGQFCDIPNMDSCGFDEDEACITMCRSSFSTLPPICDICNRKRPLLFIDMDEFISMDGRVRTLTLEAIVNERLDDSVSGFVLIRSNCQFTRDNCLNEYYILENETHLVVVALSEQECTASGIILPIPAWSLAPITFGCLLLVGAVIVAIIKCIFLILDYKEVKRLRKEAEGADFKGNPLYQDPEMKYTNVMYGKE